MFTTVPSRYSPVLRNSSRSNSAEPSRGKRPSTKSATSSGRSAIKVTSPVTQPITSAPLGEATGIPTTPHTAGHPPAPLKHQPGEVLGNLLHLILLKSADHLQVQCDQVFDFILRKPREKYSKVFSRVTPYQYNTILHAAEKLAGKPRLFYDYENFQLEVEMPSCVHDSVVNVIRRGLESVDKTLQDLITGRLIHTEVHPSLTLNTGKKEFVPDCVHVVTARCNPPIRKVPSLVEVAYSQTEAALLSRFRSVVKAYPELAMILMVVINEIPPYESPERLSHTWKELRPKNSGHLHSETSFLSMRAEPRSLDEPTPVIVGNHSWCTISNIQVQVWVRGRKSPINIDTKDNRLTARGSLYPVNADNAASMDDVTLMIMQGLSLTRDCFVEQCRRADQSANVSALRAAQFHLPFKWADVLDGLTYAMHATAHDRYRSWYYNLRNAIDTSTIGVKRTAAEAEIDSDTDDERLVVNVRARTQSRINTRAAARSSSYG
ncbi:hypothetical protein CY34DRAFT_107813 [Suillus luteus UH-Slu-Lm8-n1]|uniref:Uncharacterized protein n=1 Tax=Suillus luteus UH-Slu-Lm8-n1 TaxID=930992 RepID=A0A0D0AQK1_9AGAM|nr:hypothetical protein CY34DRAFT_107813 [Suillus luteus UH-Slu-Lm8-n1]